MKTTMLRRSVLSVAGLAFAGGVVAGPVTGVLASGPAVAADRVSAVAVAQPSGGQSHVDLGDEQKANVRAIVAATKKNGLDERAAVISVATAMQESKLKNLGDLGAANDHDSLGLFQQRPTSGWGSPDEITDPEYATTAFQKALKDVPGWHELPLTVAAQKVQVSAYPDAYAQWESQATDLVGQYWNA